MTNTTQEQIKEKNKMTNQRLTNKDLRMLLDLSEGRVPYEETKWSNGADGKIVIGTSVPVYLENIIVDVEGWHKHQEAVVSNMYIEKTGPIWVAAGAWGSEVIDNFYRLPVYFDGDGKLSVATRGSLSQDDLISVAKDISVPARGLKNVRASMFGTASFPKEVEVKGYTLRAATKKCFEHEGRLFPRDLGLFDYTSEALETWRKKLVDERTALLEKSADFMKQIPKSQTYNSLKELLEIAKLNWEYGFTRAYDDFMLASLDSEKRILLPLHHRDAEIYNQVGDEAGCRRSGGNIIVRPILSTGEIVTSEVIDKYLARE